jgi:hypothetical protein
MAQSTLFPKQNAGTVLSDHLKRFAEKTIVRTARRIGSDIGALSIGQAQGGVGINRGNASGYINPQKYEKEYNKKYLQYKIKKGGHFSQGHIPNLQFHERRLVWRQRNIGNIGDDGYVECVASDSDGPRKNLTYREWMYFHHWGEGNNPRRQLFPDTMAMQGQGVRVSKNFHGIHPMNRIVSEDLISFENIITQDLIFKELNQTLIF